MPRASDFFIQGECNCKRCRDERKLALSSASLGRIKEEIPFVPHNFDPEHSFGNVGFRSIEELDERIDKLLKRNKKKIKEYKTNGVLKSKTRYCADCGRIHKYIRENKIFRKGPKYLCKRCMKDHYRICTHCDKLLHKKNAAKVRDKWYCLECAKQLFKKCRNCGTLHDVVDLIEMHQYNISEWSHLCSRCFEEMTIECNDCGLRIIRAQSYDINDDGRPVCSSCREKHMPVHSYQYKPMPIFHFDEKREKHDRSKFYFGMEIEVELRGATATQNDPNTMAKRLLRKMGKDKIYMKTDSSLRPPAFEIVTSPQSWMFYRNIKKRWTNMLTWLEREGVDATSSGKCGIHIHINKNSFTTMHTYKFIDFVYKQVNLPFILVMSSRNGYSGNFRSYANLYIDNGISGAPCKQWAKDKGGTGHHSAVDVSGINQSTYEVRIFNGTLDPDEFHKNIEFCHALWKFTRDTSCKRNNARNFVAWLMHRNIANQYVHLVKYIVNHPSIVDDYDLYDLLKGV